MLGSNSNSTLTEEHSAGFVALGYLALLISCTSFGSMFTPLKRKDTKDGFFVQWVECSVVLVVGFFINIIRGFPQFQWIAAIGGVLYATGNVFCVPVVNGLGMGIGFLVWGAMQIIVGWSVARFGLFGFLEATEVKHNLINYIGIIIVLVSGVLFIFVKHDEKEKEKNQVIHNLFFFDLLFSYLFMTMCLAILHGLMMAPIAILKQRNPSTDPYNVFDYIWSFYSTVFVFSTIYFVLYCIIRREKAYVGRELVLPSVGYGILWTSGMTFWFMSSDRLSQTVAYPITTRLPAIISALYDVLLYKSITVSFELNCISTFVEIKAFLGG
ncbi:unnamed protein product [Haemonchus placei]|uniref:Transmembrane protein 144 n=1 Tax=Haemonchus placei TaxID=6290 RepID=A0A0N4X1H7_HAEPC|nr:unnamed protein product [Haemonchus placei]